MIDDMAVYIANLGKYNEGYLVGAWFTFPIDEEDVKEKIGLNEQYEEYAIHDTDNFPIAIGEYVSIEELNEMYEMIEELPDYIVECLDEFISHYGTLEEVVEHKDDIYYYPDCETMTDVAYYESHWGQVKWTFYCHRGLVHKIFTKKISTQLLTLLIIRAIVQLEQKRGVQREQKEQKKLNVPGSPRNFQSGVWKQQSCG